MIKTANLTANAETCVAGLGGAHCRINNNSAGTLYASAKSGIVPGGDNVTAIPAGRGDYVVGTQGTVYLLSASGGSVQVEGTDVLNRPFDNAAVSGGVAVGNPVVMDGLQGGVPFSEIVVSGKNLLKYPYADSTKTINGVTFTDNGDGTITANGTATANATIFLARNFGFENEGNYFLSGCPSGGGLNSFYINWYQNHTGVTKRNYNDFGSGNIIPYQHIFSENNTLAIVIIAGTTVNNLVFRPQLELGSTPTAYEPPITGRELTIHACGKNLLKNPYSGKSVTSKGVTFTGNSDGGIKVSGTNDGTYYSELEFFSLSDNFIFPVGKYTLSVSELSDETARFIIDCYDANNAYVKTFANKNNQTFKITRNDIDAGYKIRAYIRVYKNITVDRTYYPQVELNTAPTDYEPYSGAQYTITPDSNPYTVPNDIRQQDGFNNISVSEGELSVTGVRKNAALKKLWDEIDEIKTAIIVSNGESE